MVGETTSLVTMIDHLSKALFQPPPISTSLVVLEYFTNIIDCGQTQSRSETTHGLVGISAQTKIFILNYNFIIYFYYLYFL